MFTCMFTCILSCRQVFLLVSRTNTSSEILNCNYESLNFFSRCYIRPGSSASSLLLFHTFFLSHSRFCSFSLSCCILLLFTIISSGRILLCIFLSSITFSSPFLVFLYSKRIHAHSLSFTRSLKYLSILSSSRD